MKREQHIRRLADYAKRSQRWAILLAIASFFITGTLIDKVDRSDYLLFGLGFLGIVPLLVREWRLGTIRASFNDNTTYQRLVRLPFWLTLIGLVMFYLLLGWYDFGSPGPSIFLTIAVFLGGMYLLHRYFERIILKLEPDYITDRELHRELK